MKTRVLVFVSILLLTSISISIADENKNHVCFRVLDSNKDGFVTFEEFERTYENDKAKFDLADGNKDGKLTHDEYHDLLGHGSS